MRIAVLTFAAAIFAASVAPDAPPTLHLIGDSTMANKPDPEHNPERGWGQALPAFVKGGAVVRNYAVNGRSTKSFIDQQRWDSVLVAIKPGDYVFIQFGHNDEKKEDSTRYTTPRGTYKANLERFVREARAKGATPVLFTSIVRRSFNADGSLKDTHGEYPAVTREVAAALSVPLVDHEALTRKLVTAAGAEQSKALYVYTREGEFAAFPLARADDTHLSPRGAAEVAKVAVRELARVVPKLAPYLDSGR